MFLKVLPTPGHVADVAADLVGRVLDAAPRVRLGVATGATPLPLYHELVRRHRSGRVELPELDLFLIDEYLGLAPDDPRAFRNVIVEHLARPLGLGDHAVHAPDVGASDLDGACRAFDQARERDGLALQVLGIGGNGHVAFNEPGSPFDSRCRVVTLTERTRLDNGLGPGDPTRAVTVGIDSLLRPERLLLVATGARKAEALAAALAGPDPSSPASAMLAHPDLTIVADEAAAALLPPDLRAGALAEEAPA